MPLSDNRLTERMQAAVRAAVRGANITRCIVACSGGGDSVCLAHVAVMVARNAGWQIALGHIRHGVRADDGEDAALVERLARDLDVPVFIHQHRPETGATDEASLRRARYAALASMATDFPAAAILTGHTQDDQAETVLLRLLRGAGVDGLAGIAPDAVFPVPTMTPLRVIRPFLPVAREETRAYCAAHGLPYRDDPTNTDLAYHRNWVRHHVLPMLGERYPAAVDTLARTANLMREDAAVLREITEAALARCRIEQADVTVLDRTALRHEPISLQRRILRVVLEACGHTPRYDRLEIVRRALCEGHGTDPVILGTIALWPAYDQVVIGRTALVEATVRRQALERHPLARFPEPIAFAGDYRFPRDPSSPGVVYRLQLFSIMREETLPGRSFFVRLPDSAALTLRNRQPGDRFRPAHGPGKRTLQDYLSAQGVPAPLRDELPLLLVGNEIAMVIGYDIASTFAATAHDATHAVFLERIEAASGKDQPSPPDSLPDH